MNRGWDSAPWGRASLCRKPGLLPLLELLFSLLTLETRGSRCFGCGNISSLLLSSRNKAPLCRPGP